MSTQPIRPRFHIDHAEYTLNSLAAKVYAVLAGHKAKISSHGYVPRAVVFWPLAKKHHNDEEAISADDLRVEARELRQNNGDWAEGCQIDQQVMLDFSALDDRSVTLALYHPDTGALGPRNPTLLRLAEWASVGMSTTNR